MRERRFKWLLPLIALVMAAFAQPVKAQEIVADISEHLIAIRSNFKGTSLLLFGAIDWERYNPRSSPTSGPGFDVIIIVRGPQSDMLIRRKDRVAGIWANRKSIPVTNVPGFYTILATRPIEDILPPRVLEKREFTLEGLKLDWPEGLSADEQNEFREAFLYNLRKDDLYLQKSGTIEVIGNNLFSAKVYFPANVPVGPYLAEIYLVRNKRVISSQTSVLSVGKEGFERAIYELAHEKPALYGLAAILLALSAGIIASEVARRLS